MTPVQKQAVKDVFHLLIEKEQKPVVLELLQKLPPDYSAIILPLFEVVEPIAEQAEIKAVDGVIGQ